MPNPMMPAIGNLGGVWGYAATQDAPLYDPTSHSPGPYPAPGQTQIINASQTVIVPSWAVYADVRIVGGGGSGGGSGCAALTGGITNQYGADGGGSGGDLSVIFPVVAGTSLTVTIGLGGNGGIGGAASTGATGNAGAIGTAGQNSSIVGPGNINYAVAGGAPGRPSAANSATAAQSGVKGCASGGSLATILTGPGTGGITGASLVGGGNGGFTAGGGANGGIASATNGGGGGPGGAFSTPQAYVASGTGTAPDFNGAAGTSGATNSGGGGGGGGGGAPGGAGGNGGNGGSGYAVITWRTG